MRWWEEELLDSSCRTKAFILSVFSFLHPSLIKRHQQLSLILLLSVIHRQIKGMLHARSERTGCWWQSESKKRWGRLLSKYDASLYLLRLRERSRQPILERGAYLVKRLRLLINYTGLNRILTPLTTPNTERRKTADLRKCSCSQDG